MNSIVTGDQVFQIVDSASGSSNGNLVSLAEQQQAMRTLQQIEGMNGYVSGLVQIISSNIARFDSRLLASIQLKNVVNKRWLPRGGQSPPIVPEEKAIVKQFLMQETSESDKRIVSQVSIVLAKVARHDWPDQWPELFPTLFAYLQTQTSKQARFNALVYLLDTLSELSTKTLAFAKSAFTNLCLDLFPIVTELWSQKERELVRQLEMLKSWTFGSVIDLGLKLEILFNVEYLSVSGKVLMKLMQNGFHEMSTANYLATYFTRFVEGLKNMMSFLQDIRLKYFQAGLKLDDLCADIDNTISKMGSDSNNNVIVEIVYSIRGVVEVLSAHPVTLQKTFPLDMAPYLEPFLSFYYGQLLVECSSSQVCRQRVDRSFAISAVVLLGNVISCAVYAADISDDENSIIPSPAGNVARMANLLTKGIKTNREDDSAAARAGASLREQFFDDSKLVQLLEMCVNHLMRYESMELQEWLDDPEHFYLTQSGLNSGDTVKTSAEQLYIAMVDFRQSSVLPHIVNILRDSNRQRNCVSGNAQDNEIEFWDAVYLCCGISSASLGKHIDANDWLRSSLGELIQTVLQQPRKGSLNGGQQLLRMRFMWLLSTWMYYWDTSVIDALLQMLSSIFDRSSSSDLVVRLYSLDTLDAVLVCSSFQPALLVPRLTRQIESLCQLIGEVDDNDTKARIVELFSSIALAMGSELQPIIAPLVQYLGNIWSSSDDKSPLKRTILQVLTIIVREAKLFASALSPIAIPLIEFAVHTSEVAVNDISEETGEKIDEGNDYLLDEGISLWLALSRNLTVYSEESVRLLNTSLRVLFNSNGAASDLEIDSLKDVLMIVEANAIVGRLTCLQSCADSIRIMYNAILGKVAPRAVPYVIRPLEAFALSCPSELSLFVLQTGMLGYMLRACCAYVPGLENSMKEYLEPEVAVVSYLSMISRILLCDHNSISVAASELVQELVKIGAAPARTGSDVLLASIFKLMVDMFDMVSGSAGGVWKRKLWTLSLLSVFPSRNSHVMTLFPDVLNMVDGVLCEECDESNTSNNASMSMAASMVALSSDDAIYTGDNSLQLEPIAAMTGELIMKDIVCQASLISVAKDKINVIRSSIGDAALSQLLQTVPATTVNRILSS